MEYLNWGHESPKQVQTRRRLEEDIDEQIRMYKAFEARSSSSSTATATAAAAAGSGGRSFSPGLYTVATDGRVYSYEDFTEFPIEGGSTTFPAQTICCDRGDGSFYYLFFAAGIFWFGTIDSAGLITEYEHNIDEIASTGEPMSLYLEPDGNLIMVDAKSKSTLNNIIRIVPNRTEETAVATLVNEVGDPTQTSKIAMLFTYNSEVYAIKFITDGPPYGSFIGKYDINTGEFADPPEINELFLFKEGSSAGEAGEWTIINVVQAADGTLYMTTFFQDPQAEQYTFGIFEIVDQGNGLQAIWRKSSFINDGADIAVTLFNR